MHLSGLHLLLTYQCTFECDHCFVWGSPFQSGTTTLADIRRILVQAQDTVTSIYFEGGEAFLYYMTLVQGVRLAAQMGFEVGVVSNAYWALSLEDARQWLKPLAGHLHLLTVSNDAYHGNQALAENAQIAAQQLGIPVNDISLVSDQFAVGQIQGGESGVMHRGRAAVALTEDAPRRPWEYFDTCPYENLRDPGRVHVDPFGNLHICQGISLGNMFETPLRDICENYDPDAHPITGPLLAGGPAELVKHHNLSYEASYVDACHLCYAARTALRGQFPDILTPDQMYGV